LECAAIPEKLSDPMGIELTCLRENFKEGLGLARKKHTVARLVIVQAVHSIAIIEQTYSSTPMVDHDAAEDSVELFNERITLLLIEPDRPGITAGAVKHSILFVSP